MSIFRKLFRRNLQDHDDPSAEMGEGPSRSDDPAEALLRQQELREAEAEVGLFDTAEAQPGQTRQSHHMTGSGRGHESTVPSYLEAQIAQVRAEMKPGSHHQLYESGKLLAVIGDLDRNGFVRLADRLLKEYVAFTGHPQAGFHLALRLELRGDLSTARSLLKTYIEHAPEDLEGHYVLARIADKSQDLETTRHHLGFIVTRDISFRDAWNWYQDVRSP